MKIKLQNKNLKMIYDFLMSLTVKGSRNIHRTRIALAVKEQHEKVSKEEMDLIKDYAELDDDEEFIRGHNGNIKFKDINKFKEEQEKLLDETFVIEGENLQSALNSVNKLITDYNKALEGDHALAHFYLSEAFSNAEGGDE